MKKPRGSVKEEQRGQSYYQPQCSFRQSQQKARSRGQLDISTAYASLLPQRGAVKRQAE